MNILEITVLQLDKAQQDFFFFEPGHVLTAVVWVCFQRLVPAGLKPEGAESKMKAFQAMGVQQEGLALGAQGSPKIPRSRRLCCMTFHLTPLCSHSSSAGHQTCCQECQRSSSLPAFACFILSLEHLQPLLSCQPPICPLGNTLDVVSSVSIS